MLDKRPSSTRFRTRMDWLESHHAFSFGHHYDPDRLGFGPLRVLNEDWISPGAGFPLHPHREMEILSYVRVGALTHQDSEGNDAEIRPGRVQLMHAGTGIAHAERNEGGDPVHLLQIWIEPDTLGTRPGYEMLDFAHTPGVPTVLVSPEGTAGGLPLRQDATVSALVLRRDQSHAWSLEPGRRGWVQVVRGMGWLDGVPFEAGDAFALENQSGGKLEASQETELLLFDLPGRD